MEYRIENIIKTLQRLPDPEYENQVLQYPVLLASWEHGPIQDIPEPSDMMLDCITVKARRYQIDNHSWLEWVMSIN